MRARAFRGRDPPKEREREREIVGDTLPSERNRGFTKRERKKEREERRREKFIDIK
jgi:hypothetical protein